MRVRFPTLYTMPVGVRRRVLVTVISCAGALMLVGVALAGNGGLLPASPHSPNAYRIRDAYVFILVFTAVIFVGVEGALLLFVVRYRRGKRPREAEGPQIHGSTKLEVLWTVMPAVILAVIGGFVFYKLPGIADPPPASAAGETTITVEGRQFYWMFHYPNGAVSVGTMIAPANEVVRENVFSPDNDVIHSWWVPELGGKIDAIPGRVNHTWFEAPVGTYAARCSDLCGIQHAEMTALVKVVPASVYQRFITQRAKTASGISLGQEEYQHVCATCHRLTGAYVGPSLGNDPLLTDRANLETILRQGIGTMPAVGSDWSNAQIEALVTYTKTLTKGGHVVTR
jgi:cytochrome c oxidase subunit 2